MTKGYVTDADIAAEIREAAPGNSWADVKAAAEAVCRRLGSRDDDKTVAAFKKVLARAELPSDREAAVRERAEEEKRCVDCKKYPVCKYTQAQECVGEFFAARLRSGVHRVNPVVAIPELSAWCDEYLTEEEQQ